MNETKTEPTLETMTKEMEKNMPASKPSPKGKALLEQLNTMTPGVDDTQQPSAPAKPAGKAVAPKPEVKTPEPLKQSEATPIPAPSFKPGDPGVTVRSGISEIPPNLPFALHAIDSAKKEWLPTLMVRIANKCLAEKVFATPGAMAEAIVGASRK